MTLKRMDNVLIVVEDLEAAKAFFAELGMELEGQTLVEGPWVDSTVGLDGVRADIAMMRTPDGHGQVGLTRSTRRRRSGPSRRARRRTRWACAASCSLSTKSTTSLPACAPRCRARRRDRAVRGQLPALLRAWPRGLHRRTGRAAELNLDGRVGSGPGR